MECRRRTSRAVTTVYVICIHYFFFVQCCCWPSFGGVSSEGDCRPIQDQTTICLIFRKLPLKMCRHFLAVGSVWATLGGTLQRGDWKGLED